MRNQIVVGNIGTVLDTDSLKECLQTFKEYKGQSERNYGRASGESVTWFKDGEIYREYVGTIDSREG